MVLLYHLHVDFLHLHVVFTTTSVWAISTSVWLHLFPRTVGLLLLRASSSFLVDLWVSPTLFVGLFFFQWVSFIARDVAS